MKGLLRWLSERELSPNAAKDNHVMTVDSGGVSRCRRRRWVGVFVIPFVGLKTINVEFIKQLADLKERLNQQQSI